MRGSDRTEKHFLHLVWSLKIEYKTTETRPPRQQICRGEHCSPVLVARQTLRYTHNLLRFTNPVGERRNFCFAEIRRPAPSTFRIIAYPTNHDNPTTHGRGEQRSPVSFPHSTSWKIQTSQLPRNGLSNFCELANRNFAKPLHIFGIVYLATESLRWVFHYFIGILFFSKSVDNLLLIWYNYFVNFLSIYQLIWGVLING